MPGKAKAELLAGKDGKGVGVGGLMNRVMVVQHLSAFIHSSNL
jgi:hypothetical protein